MKPPLLSSRIGRRQRRLFCYNNSILADNQLAIWSVSITLVVALISTYCIARTHSIPRKQACINLYQFRNSTKAGSDITSFYPRPLKFCVCRHKRGSLCRFVPQTLFPRRFFSSHESANYNMARADIIHHVPSRIAPLPCPKLAPGTILPWLTKRITRRRRSLKVLDLVLCTSSSADLQSNCDVLLHDWYQRASICQVRRRHIRWTNCWL